MDESEVAEQKYINVILSCLDASNQTFLVDCHPLDSSSNVYSSIILHTVDDIKRQLEIKRENFLLFLTDDARYMSLAGKAFNTRMPRLFYYLGCPMVVILTTFAIVKLKHVFLILFSTLLVVFSR